MKSLRVALIAFSLMGAAPAWHEPTFELERNATLETAQIMFLLTPTKTPNMGVRPLAEQAKAQFARYASHPSIQMLDRMMKEGGTSWLNWLSVLNILAVSSAKPVPHASFDPNRIGFPDFDFPKQHVATEAQFMQAVNRFYIDAHVGDFLRKSQPAYDCAFAEVRKDLPATTLLSAMEEYYGTGLDRYAVLPSPFENNFVNMNVRVKTPNGIQSNMIIAPNRRAKTDQEYGCGFEEGKNTKSLVIHEFGHSFVNPILETPEMKARINQYSYLFSPIKDESTMQGEDTWFGSVIEDVVRLGEVRVLDAVGDKEGAQAKRLDEVFNNKTIYLPILEDRIKEYQADRKKYPTFQSFAPRLIDAFSDEANSTKP